MDNIADPTLSLYQQEDGVWYLNCYWSKPITFRRRVSTKTKNDIAANRFKAHWVQYELPSVREEFINEIAKRNDKSPEPANTKLADIFDYYTETYLLVTRAAPRTLTEARRIMREFELYLRAHHIGRAHQLTRRHVDEYARELGARKKAKTVKTEIGMIRAAINAAVDAGMLDRSPIIKWLLPDSDDLEIIPFEPAELAQILDAVRTKTPEIFPVVKWLAYTGNRPSDARDLRVRQIKWATNVVERPQEKTGKLGQYQIGEEAAAALRAALGDRKTHPDDHVFVGPDGFPFHRNYILRRFRVATKDINLDKDFNIKTLRHTFGYIMANLVGMPLNQLQVAMGHADIKMTLRYVRPGDSFPHIARFESLVAQPAEPANRTGDQGRPAEPAKQT